jgi:hypothetical protein
MSVTNEQLDQKLDDLVNEFHDFRQERRTALEMVIRNVGDLQVGVAKQGERINNLSIFQAGFTFVVGLIASYLGVTKK